MSIPSFSLPTDMWNHVVSFSNQQTALSLTRTCKEANFGVHDFATRRIAELAQYPKEAWGGKRLHYLLNETTKFSPYRRLSIIFNEVRRCGQFNNCHTFNDIENAIEDAGQEQAQTLVRIFENLTVHYAWAKQFLQENNILKLESDNIEHINKISEWIENNPTLIGTVEFLSLYYESQFLHLPHELRFFKNLRSIDGSHKLNSCIPIEIRKMEKLLILIHGNIDPIAEKDYAPSLYNQKLEKLNLEFFFEPLLEFFDPWSGVLSNIFGAIVSPIILLLCIVRYLFTLAEVKWNQPKTVLPF